MTSKRKFRLIRDIGVAGTLALLCALPHAIAYADEATDESDNSQTGKLFGKLNLTSVSDSNKPSKDETVFVFADSTGTPYRTTVKDTITNINKEKALSDTSSLSDIESATEDVAFTQDGEDLTWASDGVNFSYEGTTDKETPVQIRVSYTLDGESIAPEDLAGKSGHVVMRFDFTNSSSRQTNYGTTYTPFITLTGFSLDNDRFSNIQATNAKIMADGDTSTIAGYTVLGLQEDLALSTSDFDFPTYFEVSADVSDFKLDTTTTIVTNGLFNDLDTSKMSSSTSTSDLSQLTDAMNEIIAGTSSLYTGLEALADGSDTLGEGTGELGNASESLSQGTQGIADASNSVSQGVDSVAAGTGYARERYKAIAQQLEQVQQNLLNEAEALPTIDSTSLNEASASLDDAGAQGYTDIDASLESSQSQLSSSSSLLGGINTENLSEEDKAKLQSAIDQVNAANSTIGDARSSASGNQSSYDTMQTDIANAQGSIAAEETSLTDTQATIDDTKSQIAATATGEEDNELGQSIEQMGGTNEVLDATSEGAEELSEAASGLSESAQTIADASPALTEGIDALEAGSDELSEGLHSAADGTLTLSEGLTQFNEQGVQAIVDAFSGNTSDLSDRLKTMVDTSKAYDSFSGKSDDMNGSVKFIIETDKIAS